jgi:two-component system, OmpR family, KDP operon response regulator KdpE
VSSTRRILVVDDELQILRALKVVLRSAGYEVVTATGMEEALDAAALSTFSAAIVDMLLPDADGVELCERLREWSSMPIIVLSAVREEEEKVRALRAGADDYVTKPFGPHELIARLEAVLRRTAPEPEASVVASSGLEVDLAAHRVRRDGEELHLTPTEYALLRTFVRNRGRLLTHRMLLIEVWGAQYAGEVAVLRGQIANLRRKLEPSTGPRRHYLRTEPGIGYRFDPS